MVPGRRSLRVTPRPDGEGWDVVDTRSGDRVTSVATPEEALERAPGLLPGGGTVEAVNAGGFVVGRRFVPLPPDPPRLVLLAAAVRIGLALVLAGLVGWLLDASAARIVIGTAVLGAPLSVLWQLRAYRRAHLDRPRTGSAGPRS